MDLTKKQLYLLFTGLLVVSGIVLVLSLLGKPEKSTPQQTKAEETKESADLALMEVIPESLQSMLPEEVTNQDSIHKSASAIEGEATEAETKSRLEKMYGTLSEDDRWIGDETFQVDDYRPSFSGQVPDVTGITDEMISAVDGKEDELITAAQIEAYRQNPGIQSCRIELFRYSKDAVLFNLMDHDEVIGVLLYRPSTGGFEGSTGNYVFGG